MSTSPFLDQTQIIQSVYDETNETLKTSNGLALPLYDYVSVAYPDTETEIYTYKTGGSGGTTVATVTIVYTDATKENLDSVTKS
ncbi:MAG TPA: hypothetical protein PKI46_09145 [Bacteroidales bacterium]|nr:hypothetical protein [Bacteroidales bacterium]